MPSKAAASTGSFDETAPADRRRITRVNLDGPFPVTKAALPHPRVAGWGRIVNTVSDGGFARVREPRIEEPEDLVSTTLYVGDRGSGFPTGQTIGVDGGPARR